MINNLKKHFDVDRLKSGWNLAQPFFFVKFYYMLSLKHYIVVINGYSGTRDDPAMIPKSNDMDMTWRLDQAKYFTLDEAKKKCENNKNLDFYLATDV